MRRPENGRRQTSSLVRGQGRSFTNLLCIYQLGTFCGISVAAQVLDTLSPEEDRVAKEDRGFASMDRGKQRDIASKGGKAAHQKGTAHEWTSEEAREAGRKGGMASHRRKQEQQQQQPPPDGDAVASEPDTASHPSPEPTIDVDE
jgi:general stress protein YciG